MRVYFLLILLYGIVANANPHEIENLEAANETPAVTPDARCLRSEALNLADTKAIEHFNKLCEIEQEVIRLTNEHRKKNGLPALRANPELSFVVRYQASLTYNGHGHFRNNVPSYYYQKWFPNGRKLFMARENAWPPASQGKDAKTIAFNLADTRARASDGNPAGWNHHPGHSDNVLAANVTDIGVGVNILPNGAVQAYTVFATEQK